MNRDRFALSIVDDEADIRLRRLVGINHAVVVLDRLDHCVHGLPSIGALASINDVPDHAEKMEEAERQSNGRSPPVAAVQKIPKLAVMGTKLSADDAGAYGALDHLLFTQWDPIGVGALDDWSKDEYRTYLPGFWALVRTGSPDEEVARYLAAIERDRLEVETSDEHKLDIARKAAALVAAWRLPVRP